MGKSSSRFFLIVAKKSSGKLSNELVPGFPRAPSLRWKNANSCFGVILCFTLIYGKTSKYKRVNENCWMNTKLGKFHDNVFVETELQKIIALFFPPRELRLRTGLECCTGLGFRNAVTVSYFKVIFWIKLEIAFSQLWFPPKKDSFILGIQKEKRLLRHSKNQKGKRFVNLWTPPNDAFFPSPLFFRLCPFRSDSVTFFCIEINVFDRSIGVDGDGSDSGSKGKTYGGSLISFVVIFCRFPVWSLFFHFCNRSWLPWVKSKKLLESFSANEPSGLSAASVSPRRDSGAERSSSLLLLGDPAGLSPLAVDGADAVVESVVLEETLELLTEFRDFLDGEKVSEIDCFIEGLHDVKTFGDFWNLADYGDYFVLKQTSAKHFSMLTVAEIDAFDGWDISRLTLALGDSGCLKIGILKTFNK